MSEIARDLMTESYHERHGAAAFCKIWTRRFVILGFVLTLGGCSVSMPMGGLIDDSSSNAGDGKSADAPGSPVKKPAVEVAAAQPIL